MSQERRQATLTTLDLDSIRLLLQEEHICRYTITPEEMEDVRSLNKNLNTLKTAMMRRFSDWIMIILLALLTAGIWSWLERAIKKIFSGS